jgi:hypothetical protein
MAAPTIPTETGSPLLKTSYASPKRRRFRVRQIHAARGFDRTQVKGRIPVTRPVKR